MTGSSEAASTALATRRQTAEEALRGALRIDFARHLSSEVEARLLARPHFRDRFPAQALVQLRAQLDELPVACADEAWKRVSDLRTWFGAEPADETEEAAALEETLASIDDALRTLLTEFGFPGDQAPDEAGTTGAVDLEAEYQLGYRPSVNVLWAWRYVRAVDSARNELADRGAPLDAASFELVFHAPEALREDTSRPDTLA